MNSSFCKSFALPAFTLPTPLTRLGAWLPQWPHAVALTTALNIALRMKWLPVDALVPLENRTFLIEVTDAGSRSAFSFREGRFRPLFSVPDVPDLTFRGKLSTFMQLAARQEDPDTLFFNRALSIEGDTELGLVVKNMLDALEWPGA